MPATSLRRVAPVVVAMFVVASWCGWASAFRRGTWQGWMVWLVSMFAVAGVNTYLIYRHRSTDASLPSVTTSSTSVEPLSILGLAPWILLVLVGLTWDVLGLDTGPHTPHLTISALSQAFRSMDAAMLAVWIVAGLAYGRARALMSQSQPGGVGGQPLLVAFGLTASKLAFPSSSTTLGLLEGRSRGIGVGFWIAVLAGAIAIDVAARRSFGRIPTFVQLLGLISRKSSGRVLLVLAWVASGWHLFAD